MLKSQVEIGSHYMIAHTSYNRLSVVRIDSVSQYGGWNATKLSTGRTIRIKSAAKLRAEVKLNPDWVADNTARPKWLPVR